jgi:menaquinol-cytochrome c reductase iron-sulfur subunit
MDDHDGRRPGQAPGASRRALLQTAAASCAGGSALLSLWPLGAALAPDADGPAGEAPFLDAGSEADVREGAPVLVPLRAIARDGWSSGAHDLGAVFLLRTPRGLTALSAACPHLGCAVQEAKGGFTCPCHDSRFDEAGRPLHGPSPRALDPLPVRIEKGRVLVQALRFEPGAKARKVRG